MNDLDLRDCILAALDAIEESAANPMLADAALKAHAEYLAEQGLEIRKAPVRDDGFSSECDICGDPATAFSAGEFGRRSLCFAHSQVDRHIVPPITQP